MPQREVKPGSEARPAALLRRGSFGERDDDNSKDDDSERDDDDSKDDDGEYGGRGRDAPRLHDDWVCDDLDVEQRSATELSCRTDPSDLADVHAMLRAESLEVLRIHREKRDAKSPPRNTRLAVVARNVTNRYSEHGSWDIEEDSMTDVSDIGLTSPSRTMIRREHQHVVAAAHAARRGAESPRRSYDGHVSSAVRRKCRSSFGERDNDDDADCDEDALPSGRLLPIVKLNDREDFIGRTENGDHQTKPMTYRCAVGDVDVDDECVPDLGCLGCSSGFELNDENDILSVICGASDGTVFDDVRISIGKPPATAAATVSALDEAALDDAFFANAAAAHAAGGIGFFFSDLPDDVPAERGDDGAKRALAAPSTTVEKHKKTPPEMQPIIMGIFSDPPDDVPAERGDDGAKRALTATSTTVEKHRKIPPEMQLIMG